MFTGIISELGTVRSLVDGADAVRIFVRAPATTSDLVVGDSVAVNGVCLTAVSVNGDLVGFDAVPETMARTSLGDAEDGDPVNLERPTPAGGRFDGHIVQGHVDGVGVMLSKSPEAGSVRMRCSLPGELAPYVVEKGSIAVDGTSLTVTGVSPIDADEPWFEFVVIPHSLDVTTLGVRSVGDRMNLEVDVIAKYVERMMGVAK